jgi:hypothetical protein
MGKTKKAYRILVRRTTGKRPLGRQRGEEDNISMDLREGGGWNWLRIVSNGKFFALTVLNVWVLSWY